MNIMEDNYKKAYKEVIEILNFVPKESVDKIPQRMIDTFKAKMDQNYDFKVDINKSFEEQELFNLAKVTCIENDSSMRILCVLTDKEDGSKIIYSIADEGGISKVSQEEVRQQFESGMRTFSKSRETELKDVLFGTSEQSRSFQEQEIGKATVNVPIIQKDAAKKQVEKDENMVIRQREKGEI